jgi:hypothetical protein
VAALRSALFSCLTVVLVFIATHSILAHPIAQPSNLGSLSDSDLKAVVIRLERTHCLGTCPAYLLTIHGDGKVQFLDKENKESNSQKESTIDPMAVKALVSEFDRSKFLSLPNYLLEKCTCRQCTDLPSAITEIAVRGKTHRVKHDYGCGCAPKALFDLESAIDKVAKVEQWTGDNSNKGPFGTTCFLPKAAGK